MSRNYRVSWITATLINRGWFTKSEYFAEFAPEYIDPNTREKQIGRDIRVVKDVFDKVKSTFQIKNKGQRTEKLFMVKESN